MGIRLRPPGDRRIPRVAAGASGARLRMRGRLAVSRVRCEGGTGRPEPQAHLCSLHSGTPAAVRPEVHRELESAPAGASYSRKYLLMICSSELCLARLAFRVFLTSQSTLKTAMT